MVSAPVHHLEAKMDIAALCSGTRQGVKAVIDLGCSFCLISQLTVQRLGLHVRKFRKPVKFEQVNGTLLVGKVASHLTESVQLKLGATRDCSIPGCSKNG